MQNIVMVGSAEEVLRAVPDETIQCIVTSPPYFGQRDYGHPDQVGMESSVDEYVERLVKIFNECRRVLNPSGTMWLNLGDKYVDGELLGVPWRVAFALKDAGWKLRSDIIWHKPNAMPSAVKSRPTTDHEYMFLFAKSKDYFFNSDAIREPHVTFTDSSRMRGGRKHFEEGVTPERGKFSGQQALHSGSWDKAFHPEGRNKRTVWNIPLSKNRDAHFAVFPEKLVEPCIKAGSQEGDCILDPFLGSGTTAIVAARFNRSYFGIELNENYAAIARRRLNEVQSEMYV